MIIWDRRERYRFLSPDDRKDVLSYIGSKPLVNILTTFSVLLNILVPVFLYFYYISAKTPPSLTADAGTTVLVKL